MRSLVLLFLEVGHDTIHDVWLRREKIQGFDIAIGRPSISDLLDVWSKSGHCSSTTPSSRRRRHILVMFSFMSASSSMTLSSTRRLSLSTTRTFHYQHVRTVRISQASIRIHLAW